ncbi:AMIN-like domain-containing (lipo)protein [Rhodococcus zopfii]|uniref:AMIN-like domain-containing (lipo)protein n=1 Tax=Rhodococcus zopfii TaxID=43772 RepID=UPI001110FC94|nr:hypothetical protein [Rhodococcus zopfii]
MNHRRIAVVAVAAAAALTLAGCADSQSPAPPASAGTIPTTTEPAASKNLPVDATDKTSPAEPGSKLTVTDIRTGTHDGFDRVVYELGGTGAPGWRVGYVDRAVQDGSGNEVEVAGGAILQVLIDGSAYPFDSGADQYSGPQPVLAAPGGSVVEVNGAGVFEGVTQSFIGIDDPGTPFSVYALTGPARLVIDVAR